MVGEKGDEAAAREVESMLEPPILAAIRRLGDGPRYRSPTSNAFAGARWPGLVGARETREKGANMAGVYPPLIGNRNWATALMGRKRRYSWSTKRWNP